MELTIEQIEEITSAAARKYRRYNKLIDLDEVKQNAAFMLLSGRVRCKDDGAPYPKKRAYLISKLVFVAISDYRKRTGNYLKHKPNFISLESDLGVKINGETFEAVETLEDTKAKTPLDNLLEQEKDRCKDAVINETLETSKDRTRCYITLFILGVKKKILPPLLTLRLPL